ncbi:iron-containing alcohol dehydrogenase family protein [Peribacillus sp. AS_2]|uniref:iron-containing alcohol dehydrogenase family protein n=1 Tax=Peribacillus sp. AS_2 TaxID=2996755 RepID=UPI0022A71C2B|nr:iron-containing alcohol dehydrogenase family protein [Peribacillus sp. AS_2]MCZ0874423.1 iron-containing alcohol dehydrogenase family protein [Peribacillus sp. AS_2]
MLQNMEFNACLPTNVRFGLNVVKNELLNEIQQANKSRLFVATDNGLVKAGLIDSITTELTENGIETIIFSDVEPNPQAETIMQGAELYKEKSCDMIIAVGGGSAMDFAKAVGVVVSHSGHILYFRRGGEKAIIKPIPLLFAIPTTVGTGSEVTRASIVTDPTVGRKYAIASPYLIPKVAFIDPILTTTLPKHHVSATAIDALVHAIEAYTSIRSTPISDGLALQAIRMIKENLLASYANPANYEARAQIHLASTMAGMAFTLAGLGLVHSCSHPMSAVFNVAHGVANAIILPYVIEFNLISNIKKFAEIARVFKPELVLKDDQAAANELSCLLKSFTGSVDIPKDFSFLGIEVTDEIIDRLADGAMDDGTIPSNPRKVYKEDVIKIYDQVLPR